MKTLIADDDPIVRMMVSSALTKRGHAVHEAANGRDAWDAWCSGEFRLIISDWMMPDLDGLEFCSSIRAAQRPEYTYIILLTACRGKTKYLEGMTAGADDFITKPFEIDAFATRLRVAERILRLHASLSASNAELERRVRDRTAELALALQAKSDFFSRASHELRTPMNHILGFAQLLEIGALDAEQRESVEHILCSGAHLMTLIDRILAISEIDPSHLEMPRMWKSRDLHDVAISEG